MNTKILSYFAMVSLVATLLGFAFNVLELALFAVAASSMILLIAATDYAPRRTPDGVLAGRSAETLPYAA